jgi:hypothetical protein
MVYMSENKEAVGKRTDITPALPNAGRNSRDISRKTEIFAVLYNF